MPSPDPEVRRTSSKVAMGTRLGRLTEDDVRDLAAARIAVYVKKIVAQAPALTQEQKIRLAALLSGDGEQEQQRGADLGDQHDADLEDPGDTDLGDLDGGDAA